MSDSSSAITPRSGQGYTDQEIRDLDLRRLLWSEDEIDDLVHIVPNGIEAELIESDYSWGPYPNPRGYCAICRGSRHERGLIIRLSNGKRIMAGSTCGPRQFGITNWKMITRNFEEVQARQDLLIRADRLAEIAREVIDLLQVQLPVAMGVEKSIGGLGRIEDRLCFAAEQKGGNLTIEEFVDTSLMKESLPNVPSGRHRLGSAYRTVHIYQLRGLPYLRNRSTKTRSVVRRVTGILTRVLEKSKVSEGVTRTAFMNDFKALRDAIDDLRRIYERCAAVKDFYSSENLQGIAQWVNDPRNDSFYRYKVVGRSLFVPETGEEINGPDFFKLDPRPLALLEAWQSRHGMKKRRLKAA